MTKRSVMGLSHDAFQGMSRREKLVPRSARLMTRRRKEAIRALVHFADNPEGCDAPRRKTQKPVRRSKGADGAEAVFMTLSPLGEASTKNKQMAQRRDSCRQAQVPCTSGAWYRALPRFIRAEHSLCPELQHIKIFSSG